MVVGKQHGYGSRRFRHAVALEKTAGQKAAAVLQKLRLHRRAPVDDELERVQLDALPRHVVGEPAHEARHERRARGAGAHDVRGDVGRLVRIGYHEARAQRQRGERRDERDVEQRQLAQQDVVVREAHALDIDGGAP